MSQYGLKQNNCGGPVQEQNHYKASGMFNFYLVFCRVSTFLEACSLTKALLPWLSV